MSRYKELFFWWMLAGFLMAVFLLALILIFRPVDFFSLFS